MMDAVAESPTSTRTAKRPLATSDAGRPVLRVGTSKSPTTPTLVARKRSTT